MTSSDSSVTTTTAEPPGLTGLVLIYCKGLAMGAADAVPGVSGGTIALITGIYERLIRALTALDPAVLWHLPTLHRKRARTAFLDELVEMDLPFLVALGLGMVTAVVILARVVQLALSTVPGPTFAFFFGLIGASALVLYDRAWLASPGRVVAAILGFTVAFLVAGATAADALPHTLPVVFVAGAVAISGMVLPGISGAFILLLLGQYDYMTATLNSFVDNAFAFATGGNANPFLDAATVVVVFVAGAFVGLFTVAYAVRAAFVRYRAATFSFLISLMLGALRYPGIRIVETTESWTPTASAGVLTAAIVGVGAVLLLDRYTDDLDYTGTDDGSADE